MAEGMARGRHNGVASHLLGQEFFEYEFEDVLEEAIAAELQKCTLDHLLLQLHPPMWF